MIKKIKKVDKAVIKFFDKLGIPKLAQMDKGIEKVEDKLWNVISNPKTMNVRSVMIPYLFLVAFAIVTIGSTASLYAFNVPEIAKDGLRLTTVVSLVGIVGVVLHLGLNKLAGED